MIENALRRTIGESRRDAPRFPDVNYVGKAVRDGQIVVHVVAQKLTDEVASQICAAVAPDEAFIIERPGTPCRV